MRSSRARSKSVAVLAALVLTGCAIQHTPLPNPQALGDVPRFEVLAPVKIVNATPPREGMLSIPPYDLPVNYQRYTDTAIRLWSAELERRGGVVRDDADRSITLALTDITMVRGFGTFTCVINFTLGTGAGQVRGFEVSDSNWRFKEAIDGAIVNVVKAAMTNPVVVRYLATPSAVPEDPRARLEDPALQRPPAPNSPAPTAQETVPSPRDPQAIAGGTPVAPPSGERFAVIVGIGAYDHAAIPHLRYATHDADAMYEVLITRAGFRKENVLLLTDVSNQRPTLRNIKSALGTFLARSAKREDTVVVFFAGHGAPELDPRGVERDGLAKYLIPSDADPNDLYATALSMDEIHTIFGRVDAERLVMFVDSCYSGAVGGRTFVSPRVRTRDISIDGQFLDRLTRARGRAIITASRPSEVSLELAELGHGLFTYYLVEGLRGAADSDQDGVVTLQELYDYVSRQVSAKSRSVGGVQHPVMKGELEGPLPLARISPR